MNTRVRTSNYKANLAALEAAQKPSVGTPAYSRYINRPAGRRVAAAVHLIGMTPNVATAISASLSGLAILLIAGLEPSAWLGVLIAALLAGGYVMDSVDGQLARLRGAGSVSGEWLDHTVDCFKTSMLHLAVLVSFLRFAPWDSSAVLLIPIGYEVVQVVTYFGLIVVPMMRKIHGVTARTAAGPENPWRKWLILPADYGVTCLIFILFGWQTGFLAAYTAQFLVAGALLALALVRWWGELRALDMATSLQGA